MPHTLAFALLVLGLSTRLVSSALTYTHNWVDDQGVSYLTSCTITNLTKSQLGPGVEPSFFENLGPAENIVVNTMQPVAPGVVPVWHRNPKVQLVMFQSGIGNWTVPGPTTVLFKAGDVMLGEDQNATIGHASSARGATNLTMLIIQFDWQPRVNQPCWLR